MTLLEALVALVILGSSAAGVLGIFQNGARSVQSADAWNRASAAAASTLEDALREHTERTSGPAVSTADTEGAETRVDVVPWRGRVDDIIVRVTLPDGRTMQVHRLARRR